MDEQLTAAGGPRCRRLLQQCNEGEECERCAEVASSEGWPLGSVGTSVLLVHEVASRFCRH